MKDTLTFLKHQVSIFKFSFPLAFDKLLVMEFNITCVMPSSGHRSFLVSGTSHEEIKYPLKQFWVQIMTHAISLLWNCFKPQLREKKTNQWLKLCIPNSEIYADKFPKTMKQ